MAVGIFSFCFLAVVGLVPVGVKANRDTIEETRAAGIARAIEVDFETVSAGAANTPRFGIPLPTVATASTAPNTTLFFAEDCSSTNTAAIASGSQPAHYRADVFFGGRSSVSVPAPLRILVTWPALANPQTGQWPTQQNGSFEVVTTLHP
jgi:hypothetical protein